MLRRSSVRGLMTGVFFLAVALAALKNADRHWGGACLLAAWMAIGVAAIGAVVLHGRDRRWWAGFAFLSAFYLMLTSAPWFSAEYGSNFITTTALESFRSELLAPSPVYHMPPILWWQHNRLLRQVERLKADGKQPGDQELDGAMGMLISLEAQLSGTEDRGAYFRVGHSLFALLAGLLGGKAATWFHAKRG